MINAMNMQELRSRYRDFILARAAEHGLTNVRVFGSVARGTATEASDLDLLVDLERRVGLFTLVKFQGMVADMLGMPVQVVTEKSLSPLFRDRVLHQAVAL